MKSNQHHIDKLTPEVIERYLSGDLTHSQMHQVEKLLLESDFDAEAMEGFEETGIEGLQRDIIDLNARIEARVKTEDRRLYFYLKIAASVLLIAIATFVTIELIPIDQSETISQSEDTTESFEESLAPPESKDEISDKTNNDQAKAPINETVIPETSTSDVLSMKEPSSDEITVSKDEQELIALDFEMPEETLEDDDAINDETLEAVELPETSSVETEKLSKTRMAAKRAPAFNRVKKLKGKIITEDSTPLPGVNVIVKGTTLGTVTDIDGNYSLGLPANSDSTVVASFIGYESKEVNARGKSTLDIQLLQDNVQLSEVVVTAAGEESQSLSRTAPSPEGGMKAFETYLENNAANESRSAVTVSFVVNEAGNLSSFKIIKGDSDIINNKAINLIKNGPAWLPAKKNNNPVTDTVVLKIKFKPIK